MVALSKRVLPALCVSLFASTASASIPDADGVIHGCYNVLTGSTRIVDGNSCNLFEKQVTWQQRGPQGPQGPQGAQGPQGPQGPAGSSSVAIGHGSLRVPISATGDDVFSFVYDWRYTAVKDATCNVSVSVYVLTNDGAPSIRVAPAVRGNGVSYNVQEPEAQLQSSPNFTHGYIDGLHSVRQQGATSSGFNMTAGTVYEFGVRLTSEAPLLPQSNVYAEVTWTCQEDDSNPGRPVSSNTR